MVRESLRVYNYDEYRKVCADLAKKVNKGELSGGLPEGSETCVVIGEDNKGDYTEWDLNYYGKKDGYILAYYNKYSNVDSPAGEAEFKNIEELDRAIKEILGKDSE